MQKGTAYLLAGVVGIFGDVFEVGVYAGKAVVSGAAAVVLEGTGCGVVAN